MNDVAVFDHINALSAEEEDCSPKRATDPASRPKSRNGWPRSRSSWTGATTCSTSERRAARPVSIPRKPRSGRSRSSSATSSDVRSYVGRLTPAGTTRRGHRASQGPSMTSRRPLALRRRRRDARWASCPSVMRPAPVAATVLALASPRARVQPGNGAVGIARRGLWPRPGRRIALGSHRPRSHRAHRLRLDRDRLQVGQHQDRCCVGP